MSSPYATLSIAHRIEQTLTDIWVDESKRAGIGRITARQAILIDAIANASSPSQTDLTHITGIDRSTLAEMTKRLVEKGFIKRRRNRDDARAYSVSLTDEGKRLASSVAPVVSATTERLSAAVAGLKGLRLREEAREAAE